MAVVVQRTDQISIESLFAACTYSKKQFIINYQLKEATKRKLLEAGVVLEISHSDKELHNLMEAGKKTNTWPFFWNPREEIHTITTEEVRDTHQDFLLAFPEFLVPSRLFDNDNEDLTPAQAMKYLKRSCALNPKKEQVYYMPHYNGFLTKWQNGNLSWERTIEELIADDDDPFHFNPTSINTFIPPTMPDECPFCGKHELMNCECDYCSDSEETLGKRLVRQTKITEHF